MNWATSWRDRRPWLLFSVACLLAGCRTPNHGPDTTDAGPRNILVNCYSLLHQVLDEEKDVYKLRFIKQEPADLKVLTKKIAAASGAGAKRLEEIARADRTITLADLQLPQGEQRTRAAIASTKRKELLGDSGDEFEINLLLTQTEALTYAWHLAKVAAKNEPQPERARYLSGLSDEMRDLDHEAVSLLLLRMNSPAAPIRVR